MTDILALDLATKSGWAFGPADPQTRPYSGVERFKKTGASEWEAFGNAITWTHTFFKLNKPGDIVIEAPVSPVMLAKTNVQTTRLLFGLAAVIGAVANRNGIYSINTVPSSSVRSKFIGRGNLKGDVAKKLVAEKCLKLGWIDEEQVNEYDRTDALALWAYRAGILSIKCQLAFWSK